MCQINKINADEDEPLEKAFVLDEAASGDNMEPAGSTENESDILLESGSEPAKGAKELLEALQSEISQLIEVEQKIQKVIEFMEMTLAQKGTPHFKSFWEARNICTELFKQNVSPAAKQPLWSKYIELSKEARRLREILDEQSAFAAEQIELAIQALEKDLLEAFDATKRELDILSNCKTLQSKSSFYHTNQSELDFLNTQASRITALRKELIRTNMRIRVKNKFFQRLSLAGDKVFPRRKELIKNVSQNFLEDIERFATSNFASTMDGESLFDLREEIKVLQALAKILTLNTQAFTQTRLRLSECWDKVKSEEKERKKIRTQQKAAYKQNFDEIQNQITQVSEKLSSSGLTIDDLKNNIDEIVQHMREVELGHEELKILRQGISTLKKALEEKIQAEEQKRLSIEDEKERQRRKIYDEIIKEISHLISNSENFDMDTLILQKGILYNRISEASISKKEKMDLEKKLKSIQDVISDKKEKAILSLSDDDRQALNQLKDLLNEKKERRQEIKDHIESLRRKSKGSSGMDFEQAMQSSHQLEAERSNLEKINASIQEIEEKIEELEYQ